MNIYLSTTEDFENNGLGFLTDIISAKIVEGINDKYQLEISYLRDGHLSEYLVEENIIKSKVADGSYQLFRIKNIKKDFKTISIVAYHIFYDLLDNFLEDVYPKGLTGQPYLEHILRNTQYENKFHAISDISDIATGRYVRKNPVEAILGDIENSIINLFGGEIKRDNFNISLLKRLGADNGVKLFIGKNITGIDIATDITEMATRIMPIGFDGLKLPELYVDSPLINNYPSPKIKLLEFSDVKYDLDDENAFHVEEEAFEELRRLAREQFSNGIDKPSISVKIDWVELSKTNEYKNFVNLERVNLGDTITTYILGLDYETRVIKTEYNPLTDMIEKFEIGTVRPSFESSVNNLKDSIKEMPTSILEEAKTNATNLITHAMGGYIYKTQSELFIMDTNDPATAQKVWRWNINGLGYSANGIDGPYELAMTMDGQIVADFITTGKLNTNVIEGYDSLILQVDNNTDNFNNFYDKDKVDTMLINAETGITNTFSEAGGNNIFRNTGLWFEENGIYEYWEGTVKRATNDNSANHNSMLLQNGNLIQEQEVSNGNYSISFYYQKLNELATASVVINDVEYPLDSLSVKQFYTGEKDNETNEYITQPIVVNTGHLKIEFKCDTNNAVEIYDLMANKGTVKLAYSQNENETTTDTVNISKGITITSSNIDVIFKANADGIRIYTMSGTLKTYFTDKGLTTKEAIIEDEAQIVGTLWQEVEGQTWITRM